MAVPYKIPGPRIAIIGVTGSGKTTTAARLSVLLKIPHVELDSIHWQPNWVPLELEPFRAQVAEAITGPAWVTDGNYGKVRDIIWSRATTIIWLDYPLPLILWQLAVRTSKRVFSGEVLWNDNRETLRGAFFSRDSLFVWAVTTYARHRREYPLMLSRPEYAHLQLIHLHSRREMSGWLDWLSHQTRQAYLGEDDAEQNVR